MSVGLVSTQRVVLFDEDDPLLLSGGAKLVPVEVAYETYGTLNDGPRQRRLHLSRPDRRRPRGGVTTATRRARAGGTT